MLSNASESSMNTIRNEGESNSQQNGLLSVEENLESLTLDRFGHELNQLQVENESLRAQVTCRACGVARVDTILMPCGHLVCCEACARSRRKCPLPSCEGVIGATAKVHM